MKHNYINDDIVIDFEVPMVLKNLMLDAEKADLEEDEGTYLNYADTINVWAKNYYQDGVLSNLHGNYYAVGILNDMKANRINFLN